MERRRYSGPSPVRALTPIAVTLLATGFVVRAAGHDPVALALDLARWAITGGPA